MEEMNWLNTVIVEGEVVEQTVKLIELRNVNKFGVSYISAEFRGKKLMHSLGDMLGKTLRVVGVLCGSRIIVEYAEYKPEVKE